MWCVCVHVCAHMWVQVYTEMITFALIWYVYLTQAYKI